jgi:hypothetical protein
MELEILTQVQSKMVFRDLVAFKFLHLAQAHSDNSGVSCVGLVGC